MALHVGSFERQYVIGQRLRVDGWPDPTVAEWAAQQFWHLNLHAGGTTYLSFAMIGRLAELLLRLNPLVRDALRLTYSHVFLDEFQDTTKVQFDLVRTAFLGSGTVVTAVGDIKQQIMRWANAMEDPFGRLETVFGAKRVSLFSNYRSSPKLVRIQHFLARALDANVPMPQSKKSETVAGDVCAVWRFSTPEVESAYLADFVATSIDRDDLKPRDFALLVRQKASDYADRLQPAFADRGLPLCNEAEMVGSVTLQDLLTEDFSRTLILLLRVATSVSAPKHWTECLLNLASLRGMDPGDHVAQRRLALDVDCFARRFQRDYSNPVGGRDDAEAVVAAVQDFVGRDVLIAAHPAYRQGDWFSKVMEACAIHLCKSAANSGDWAQALDGYEGQNAIPLMTIHKSKSLEYHTVMFVGLDDQAWWSFPNDPVEGKAAFFVAFSRAMQRVVFTYCESSGDIESVTPLYDLLETAGVDSLRLG